MSCSLKHIKYLYSFAVQRGFSFPPESEGKDFPWMRSQYNGIGAEWMPRFLRKLITKLFSRMEAAALFHDIDFLNPNKKYYNFIKANVRLAYNGIKSGCPFSALLLAVICQLFGWSAWKDGKETMAWYYYFQEDKKQ